jgi:hypothetical protein
MHILLRLEPKKENSRFLSNTKMSGKYMCNGSCSSSLRDVRSLFRPLMRKRITPKGDCCRRSYDLRLPPEGGR